MVQTNQRLFTNGIQVFESPYNIPLPFIVVQGFGNLVGGGEFIEPDFNIFDGYNNPIVKPGNILRFYDSGMFYQAEVVGYTIDGWIQLSEALPGGYVYFQVFQQNENPGCAIFVNGHIHGDGSISIETIDGTFISFQISSTENYILPVIAKKIDSATSQNGIYALY
jgi:hypothetical protein